MGSLITNSLGPMEIGIIVSIAIYGVTIMQTYLYYTDPECHSSDGIFIKVFVGTLMSLDTLHAVLLPHFLYVYTIQDYADFMQLGRVVWSFPAQIIVGEGMSTCVQFFFAYRIYRISKNRLVIPLIACLLSIIQLGFALAYAAIELSPDVNPDSLATSRIFLLCAGSLTPMMLCDSIITISTIHYLKKNRSAFSSVNRLIKRTVIYVMSSGLLTTIFAAITVVMFAALPNTMDFIPFYVIMVRLLSCSFMSTLNSRRFTRRNLRRGSTVTNNVINLPRLEGARISISNHGGIQISNALSTETKNSDSAMIVGNSSGEESNILEESWVV